MKQCLYCKKDFEEKKPTAKYCSNSCRVMYNRKHGGNSIKPFQMKVLYNELMQAISELREVNTYKSFDSTHGIVSTTEPQQATIKISKEHYYKPTEKTFQQHMNEIAELQFEDEYRKKYAEIEASSNLSPKQKELLYQNMKTSKL